jgi:hypothetical protein
MELDHICWTDDTLCDECGAVDMRHAVLNYINAFEQTFGTIHKRVK